MMRQMLHLKAPGNWINDPNGFIYYNGIYHMFYQHFPYAPEWGTMHWGHAVSKDLVNWEHRGVALYPTKYEDQNGCFSGSALEYNGKMYLYYTGVHYHKPDPENVHMCLEEQFESAQMMITSEDGFHFDNLRDKQVVIPALSDASVGDRTHTRDPKVWRGKDAWYMILGSSDRRKKGKLLIYKSDNLYDWIFFAETSKNEQYGWMWECPDYFEVDGCGVLSLSPMGVMSDGKKEANQAVCVRADFDEETGKMEISDEFNFFDYGLDLYAAQSTTDELGRRTVIAWLRMPEAVDGKWNGMYCLPRLVQVRDGHICFPVHPHIKAQFIKEIASPKEAEKSGYCIQADLPEGASLNVGGYQIFRMGNHTCTDRSAVFAGHEDYRMQFETPEIKNGRHLDIYVEEHLIEVFVNDGEYVISNAVYGLNSELRCKGVENLKLCTIMQED